MEKLYKVDDVAERYGVKNFTVWDWIRSGKLKAFKVGKLYQIKESALKAFEEGQMTEK